MLYDVTVAQLQKGIYLASCPLGADEPDVRAALLLGEKWAVVVDTLTCPEDMAPLREIIAAHGRPALVVNTHADWDHAWGNAAFPDSLIVGQRICRERLLGADERAMLAQKRAEEPDHYAAVALIPPAATFETALTIDLGGLTMELHHVPGHTPDCLMVHVPERRLIYAGDWAEDPFPLLESGPLDGWIASLRAWSTREVETVIPAHGRIGGGESLHANAAYLESLRDDPPAPPGTPPFYVTAHAENVAAARRLAGSQGTAL